MKADHDSLKLDWPSWLPVVAKSDYVKVEREGHKLDYYRGESWHPDATVIIMKVKHDSLLLEWLSWGRTTTVCSYSNYREGGAWQPAARVITYYDGGAWQPATKVIIMKEEHDSLQPE
jgi:hypothetical protein